MLPRKLKNTCFVIEGLNSLATVYYFYYIYFYMQQVYGFDNRANLLLAAVNGAVYAGSSLLGGKAAQRFGYYTALKCGLLIMAGSLAAGSRIEGAVAQMVVVALGTVGQSLTWPSLEALVSEGESHSGVQHMVGTCGPALVRWLTSPAGPCCSTWGSRACFMCRSPYKRSSSG